MGAMKEQKNRKSTSTRRVQQPSTGGAADWMNVDPTLLQNAVATVAYYGGALRFGYTRDGGAMTIGVYGDGEPYTDYLKPSDDPNDYLRKLIAAWGKAGG